MISNNITEVIAKIMEGSIALVNQSQAPNMSLSKYRVTNNQTMSNHNVIIKPKILYE